MIRFIDETLNGITQYRLMLYFLVCLLLVATALSVFGILSFNPVAIVFSAVFLTIVCWVANTVFARIFEAQTNLESVYISALILALIMTPARTFQDALLLGLVAVLSQGSKYILAIGKKHIFNPAAFAVFLSAVTLNYSASWWVGTAWMMPFVLAGGLLIARKIRRFNMVIAFLIAALVLILGSSLSRGIDALSIVQQIILETPILFFAFVMLTEPQTTPPGRIWRMVYGGLVGLLFVYFTPETVLLAGNVFSYIISPKEKLLLTLKEKIQIAPDIYDFVFGVSQRFNFLPGQYMEWTYAHKNPDSRGTRRYFTIAASPTEGNLRIGVKFYPNGSSFKKNLLAMQNKEQIVASQLSGEFTLPKDVSKKLCFIAGGIGITPFRSMVKSLLDTNQKRNIVLLFSNKLASDIVYDNIFDKAFQKLGIKTVYVLTDTADVPKEWSGRVGFIDAKVIQEEVPDYLDRIFYISGPHSMVDAFEKVLKGLGIAGNQIKIDFFPGYA